VSGIHLCKLPFPKSGQEGYRRGRELVVCSAKNLQILLRDYRYIATTTDSGQIYIWRICGAIMREADEDFVRGRNLRRTSALVLFGNIFEGQRQVPQRVY
jgi:hypothetical protein